MSDQESNHKITQGLPHEGEVHEYQPDPQSTVDYLRSIAPHKKRHTGKRIAITLLVLLIAAGIGAAAYWFVLRPKPAPVKTTATTQQTAKPQTVATATRHRTSSIFSLDFDYPEDWKVSEVTGSGQLFVRSPRTELKKADGQTVKGQIVFTIRDKNQTLSEFTSGNAIAARESEKIDYAKPSSTQRGSTYLSFLRYTANTDSKSMNGIYVTGDNGYQLDQYVPKADFTPVDPIISITFVTCANQDCTGSNSGTPMAIAASEWDNTSLSGPLKKMLASLVVN